MLCTNDSILCHKDGYQIHQVNNLLIVDFNVCKNGGLFRKSFPVLLSSKLLSIFSFIRFSVLLFTLMTMIHLEFCAALYEWIYLDGSAHSHSVWPALFNEEAAFSPVCISRLFIKKKIRSLFVNSCVGIQFISIDQYVCFLFIC